MATKKTSKKTTNLSTQQKVGIGIGLTAAAVTAAGAYFLYGSDNAAKNRKKVKSWMLKAKAEVLETMEKAQDMTQEEYEKLIESVSGAYGRLKDASKVDVATFKREMKAYWGDIEKAARPLKQEAKKAAKNAAVAVAGTAARKAVKKVTKRAAKKTSKKAAKKKTS